MPTIELRYHPNKKKKNYPKKNIENHIAVYNTDTWRKLRIIYLKNNPLCEKCKENNILTLATLVHHRNEISNGKTILDKKLLGYDYTNLMALCSDCHIKIHHGTQTYL